MCSKFGIFIKEGLAFSVAGIFLGLLLRTFVLPVQPPSPGVNAAGLRSGDNRHGPRLEVGSIVSIPGIDFRGSDQTIVLAVSPDCPLCEDIGHLYRRLSAIAERRRMQLVVVLPEGGHTSARGGGFLDAVGDDDRVVRTDLRTIGVEGTPTILVADRNGKVVNLWIGRLLPEHQQAMFARLDNPKGDVVVDLDPESGVSTTFVVVEEVGCADSSCVLIDTREREEFSIVHRSGAVNIPRRELQVRSTIEISRGSQVIVDCSYMAASECAIAAEVLRREGFRRIRLLNPWTRSVRCRMDRVVR